MNCSLKEMEFPVAFQLGIHVSFLIMLHFNQDSSMANTPREAEIMTSWAGSQGVMVSVVCTTFNHAPFIDDAIQGFLKQQTTFPFEIIIHDDASTDRSQEIIRKYSSEYPNLLKPLLQSENQFSKGGFKPSIYAANFSSGKYIALCEGDDFWVCNEKLQTQFDAMERHPEVDFSFHSAMLLREGVSGQQNSWCYEHDRIIALDELMTRYTGKFAPTASYLFRRTLIDRLPEWFYSDAPVGDFFIERYGALRGGAIYIDRPMSVYREMAPQSWSAKTAANIEIYGSHVEKMLRCLQLMDQDFAEYSSILRRHGANLNLNYSLRALFGGNNEKFIQLINASVAQHKYVSNKQRLAYFMRFCPTILKWILQGRNKCVVHKRS